MESSEEVSLREITADTLDAILDLDVADDQRRFVASNARSIAQASFSNAAWCRGVYAGETPVGFVLLYENTEKYEYVVWRFMIGADHQGRGYGKRAMELVIEHVQMLPEAAELLVSYVPGKGEPRPFYERLGFADTGVVEDGERVMRLDLETRAAVAR